MTERMLIIITLLSVLVLTASSGCINEEKAAPTILKEVPIQDVTMPEIENNLPEINIDSFYIVYKGDNLERKDEPYDRSFNFTEKYYIAYNLIIKNNGMETLNFTLNDLQLFVGDQIVTTSNINDSLSSNLLDVWSAFENENKLNDIILLPNQTIKGTIVFNVKNYDVFSERSFSLRYLNTPVTSPSFEKSLSALTIAESYDYSTIFGIPPYIDPDYSPEINYYWIYSNWVNRSMFEYYKMTDPENLSKEKQDNLPFTEIAYLIKVIPERNITVFQDYRLVSNDKKIYRSYGQENRFHIVDDKGIELSNTSIIKGSNSGSLAVRNGQTYQLYFNNYPQMNFSNVTIIRFSFNRNYGWGLAMIFTFINQDIILNENQEIVLARYDYKHIYS